MPELFNLVNQIKWTCWKTNTFLFSLLDLQTLDAQNGLVGGFCVLCVVLNVILVVQISFRFLSANFGSRGPKNDFGKISLGLFSIFHILVCLEHFG